MLNETFSKHFLKTINEMHENPVALLFNQWWNEAPEDVKASYLEIFLADPANRTALENGRYAEPLDLEELAAMPANSLGKLYRDWIVDNGLTEQIAMDYRKFHESMESAGQLDGMPQEMRFAVLRGFQLHDFMHVLSGYDPSPRGEIALQAFSLAQLQFPYFGMWMSVSTTQMTFLRPESIVPLMDAISDGWQYGRRTPNIMLQDWENELERDIEDIRAEWNIVPSPLVHELRGETVAA